MLCTDSRGKSVECLLELREEVLLFLQAHNTDLALSVSDKIWPVKLAYPADIFNLLNGLNLSLKGRDNNFLISQNKIVPYTKKFQIWKNRINDNVLHRFPIPRDYITKKPLITKFLILPYNQKHLELLSEHFKRYFVKETYEDFNWVLIPFAVEKLSSYDEKKKN